MLDTPQLAESAAERSAVIRLCVPREQIRVVMGPGIQELMAVAAAQGIGPTGPWFSRHFRLDPEVFDFEIGVPVSAAVAPTGRVVAGSLPAERVARAVMHGGYEGLATAWPQLRAWLEANGHTAGAEFWERYVVGPESGPDPAGWRTELNWIIRG